MKTNNKIQECDTSRRRLLKKVYVAPVVVALGTMTLSSPAEAMSKRGGGGQSYGAGDRTEEGRTVSIQQMDEGRRGGSSSLHQDNGWGNGDDAAPGRSLPHNNAENGGGTHPIHGDSNPN